MRNSRQGSDRVLGCLAGGLLGTVFVLLAGIVVIVLLEEPDTTPPPPRPSSYAIEAIVEEDYINRTMLESTAEIRSPVPVIAGHMDIHPDALTDFQVKVKIGPVRPVVRGTVALRIAGGRKLEVELVEARMGNLPITAFVPANALDPVNEDVNRQLSERIGAADMQLIGITSDETTLRFYLNPAP